MTQHVSIRDYFINPVVLNLTEEELNLRERVINTIIDTNNPYTPTDHKELTLLKDLANRNVVSFTQDHVTCIYPISAVPTNKKVIFADGREAYAMCAIDAIGCHYAFRQDIIIESECERCHDKIVLKVSNGRIEILQGSPEVYVLHADLQGQEKWSCSCCNIMHFFNCKETLEQWLVERNINSKVFALDLETANKMAWLLFSK